MAFHHCSSYQGIADLVGEIDLPSDSGSLVATHCYYIVEQAYTAVSASRLEFVEAERMEHTGTLSRSFQNHHAVV